MGEITYNIKLQFPNPQEKNFWLNLLKEERSSFNLASEIVFNKHPKINLKEVYDVCYYPIRNSTNLLPAQGANKVIKEVISCYRSIKSNKHNLKDAPKKEQLSMRLDKRLYSNFSKTSIKLVSSVPHKRIEIKFKLYDKVKEMFDKYTACDPLIFFKNNSFFLSVSFKVPDLPKANEEAVGVDLGCRRLFTTSEGKTLLGNEFNFYKRKVRFNKRKLQSKKKSSHSARTKLNKLSHRERNFSKKYIELAVNELIKSTNKSIIVLEDLTKIKQKTNKKGSSHNNRLSQIPFYLFKQILSYKTPLVGKQVETVNPAYTSQLDCRGIEKGERKNRRYYTTDNLVFDSDWNAAINIANKFSKHPISSLLPLDGKLDLMGRLLSSNQSSN